MTELWRWRRFRTPALTAMSSRPVHVCLTATPSAGVATPPLLAQFLSRPVMAIQGLLDLGDPVLDLARAERAEGEAA
ncbi:MAG: hypothetical protein ACR2PL_11505 [Dehalococcoidia bacterium]